MSGFTRSIGTADGDFIRPRSALGRRDEKFATTEAVLRTPFKDRADLMRVIDGLRKAGLEIPDEPAAAD